MTSAFDAGAFIDHLNSGQTDAAMALMASDGEWHVPGDPKFGGRVYKGPEELKDFLKVVVDLFPKGLSRVWSREWKSDGGVILEATLEGEAVTGRLYRNDYAFVFVLNETGQVQEVREYQDIAPLAEALEGWDG